MNDWRSASLPGKGRDGNELTENGLQAHLRVVHGYAMTRLTGLETIRLVVIHQREHEGKPWHD